MAGAVPANRVRPHREALRAATGAGVGEMPRLNPSGKAAAGDHRVSMDVGHSTLAMTSCAAHPTFFDTDAAFLEKAIGALRISGRIVQKLAAEIGEYSIDQRPYPHHEPGGRPRMGRRPYCRFEG